MEEVTALALTMVVLYIIILFLETTKLGAIGALLLAAIVIWVLFTSLPEKKVQPDTVPVFMDDVTVSPTFKR